MQEEIQVDVNGRRFIVRNLGKTVIKPYLCDGKGAKGNPCNRIAARGSHYCRSHNPRLIAERKAALIKSEEIISPQDFVFRFCHTLDPHDKNNPIKLFPQLPYMEELIKQWVDNPLLLVVKSRQMMASWLFVALHLWDIMYHEGRTAFFISKKEEDAGFGNNLSLLARAKFMLDHMPEKMRPRFKISARPPSIEIIGKYSSIMACSQDAEALRQYTASRILSDEMAFQERAEKAYIAMKPTIDGGGALTGISTPNGRMNLFYHLVNDIKKEPKKAGQVGVTRGSLNQVRQESIGTGLWRRNNRNGFTVIGLHYSACPIKNADWIKKSKNSYVSADAWNQEQELDFTKTEGTRVYPAFRMDKHVRRLTYNPYRTIWRGWDFGYGHPAVVWCQIDEDDRVCILKEFMGEEVVINDFAKEVKKLSREWFPGCSFKDAGDPAGRQRNDKSERTTVDILRSMGIKVKLPSSSVKEGLNSIRGLLIPRMDDKPGLMVDPYCEIMVDGFLGGYIRKDSDEPVKDGYFEHLMDAFRYFIVANFDARTYKPYKPAKVYIPHHPILDPITGS